MLIAETTTYKLWQEGNEVCVQQKPSTRVRRLSSLETATFLIEVTKNINARHLANKRFSTEQAFEDACDDLFVPLRLVS